MNSITPKAMPRRVNWRSICPGSCPEAEYKVYSPTVINTSKPNSSQTSMWMRCQMVVLFCLSCARFTLFILPYPIQHHLAEAA